MKPIERTFDNNKQEVMNRLPSALKASGMSITGRNDELGLIGFRKADGLVIYAHIVEEKPQLTRVSLAPGLSYVGERNPSEMPAEVQEVLREMDEVMNKGQRIAFGAKLP